MHIVVHKSDQWVEMTECGAFIPQCRPIPALRIIFVLLAAVLLLLWEAVAFGNVPGLQAYVVMRYRTSLI